MTAAKPAAKRWRKCRECKGTGKFFYETNLSMETCERCQGKGKRLVSRSVPRKLERTQ